MKKTGAAAGEVLGDSANWDFSRVPEEEELACCLYEYARESQCLADLWRTVGHLTDDEKEKNADFRQIGHLSLLGTLTLSLLKPDESFECKQDVCAPSGPFSFIPWQRRGVLRQRKALLVADFAKRKLGFTTRFMDRIGIKNAADAAQRFTAEEAHKLHILIEEERSWTEFAKTYQQGQPVPPVSAKAEAAMRPTIRERVLWSGAETLVAKIDWHNSTNAELVESFEKWVNKSRPHWLGKAHAKGRHPRVWRTRLERLAVMRLLQIAPPAELKRPEHGLVVGGQVPGRKWYEFRKEARAIFWELFPFVGKEDPISFPIPDRRGKVRAPRVSL